MDTAREREILNASTCAAILRMGQRFCLIDLDGSPLPNPTAPEWKGAEFYGCLGFAHGRVSVSLEHEIDPADVKALSAAFVQMVANKLTPRTEN